MAYKGAAMPPDGARALEFRLTTSLETESQIPMMKIEAAAPAASHQPRVLVLHGLSGAKHHWLPYMYMLAMNGFTAYSLDLCMHGDWPDAARRDELFSTKFPETLRHIIYDSAKMIRKLVDSWQDVTTPLSLVGISA